MITVYSADHKLHDAGQELFAGQLVPAFEKPERADMVLARLGEKNIGRIIAPDAFNSSAVTRIHDPAYLNFLNNFWDEWTAAGYTHNGSPVSGAVRWMSRREPEAIEGKVSLYSHDFAAPITKGTWAAAKASASTALTAGRHIREGATAAFALCRPPGHHAHVASCGGYCFLNNAAIAAQAFLDNGSKRVAILDVDYHHGNGTQAIFYQRSDVFFASLHGDPRWSYPYFLGYSDERGEGEGEGANRNCPLPPGTEASTWFEALDTLLVDINKYKPEVLIVSLGVDTFEGDPISSFKLKSDDFLKLGERLAGEKYPTLFVFEGGYSVADLGVNVVNVLEGFEAKKA